MLLRIVIPILLIKTLNAAICDDAPDDGRRQICRQISMWKSDVQSLPKTASLFPKLLLAESNTIFDCMTIQCICGYINDPTCRDTWGKSVRKEYRMLTDDERQRYHKAMWKLKENGDYFTLSNIHASFALSPGAHSGPAFLPWHREYIKRMEIALRRVDRLLPGVPYWDSTLDGSLPNPRDSVLFSNELMGSPDSDEIMRHGAFANWTINDGSRVFERQYAVVGQLFTESDLNRMSRINNIGDFLAFTAADKDCPNPATWDCPEFIHGKPHVWTGGDMLITRTSTYDPMFYLHHSFIDWVWENWRQNKQTRGQRETQYPPDNANCSSSSHFSHSELLPFKKNVIDALSNQYFDELSSYQPRPNCTWSGRDCGSKYLFCDISHGAPRCASKVMVGGNCTGYTGGEDICYLGQCIDGLCAASDDSSTSSTQESSTEISSTTTASTTTTVSSTTTTTTTSSSTITTPTSTTISSSSTVTSSSPATTQKITETFPSTISPTSTSTQPSTTSSKSPAITQNLTDPTCLNQHFCCIGWARTGLCEDPDWKDYMTLYCSPSCGFCTSGIAAPSPQTECRDILSTCPQRIGTCTTNAPFMRENCKVTCDQCWLINIQATMFECGLLHSRTSAREGLPPILPPGPSLKQRLKDIFIQHVLETITGIFTIR